MIRLFKDLNIKYYITQLIGLLILLSSGFFAFGKTGNKLLYSIIIFITLTFIILTAYRYTKKATIRLIELSKSANNNRNIKESISSIEEILSRAKNNKVKTIIIIILTGLYINIGETKKAMTLYKDFTPEFDKTTNGAINQIMYLNNICKICIREKLFSLAKENLNILKKLIENDSFDEETTKTVNTIYRDRVVELGFKENKIKDNKSVAKYYLKRFNEEKNNVNKVFFAYQLSKVYKKSKNKKEAERYKKYYDENREELNYN